MLRREAQTRGDIREERGGTICTGGDDKRRCGSKSARYEDCGGSTRRTKAGRSLVKVSFPQTT